MVIRTWHYHLSIKRFTLLGAVMSRVSPFRDQVEIG
jgi:hypothetical protein